MLIQEIDGEAIVLNMADNSFYGFDGVATRMLQLIRELGQPDQVVQRLVAEYDVDEGTLRQDLDAFTNELATAGLLAQVSG